MEVSCKNSDCTQSGGRGLFATHYAKLADAHEGSSSVASRHMACEVSMMPSGREQVRLTLGGIPLQTWSLDYVACALTCVCFDR